MDVKNIIKSKRIELGFTMKELAKRVGVSEGTISRWESGEISNMRRDKVALLSQVLQIPISDLMGWTEAKPAKNPELSKDESELLSTYRSLSDPGKKRVRNYASSVLDLESQEQELYAAHHREGVTDISDHDRAIMEDDSEWDD